MFSGFCPAEDESSDDMVRACLWPWCGVSTHHFGCVKTRNRAAYLVRDTNLGGGVWLMGAEASNFPMSFFIFQAFSQYLQ